MKSSEIVKETSIMKAVRPVQISGVGCYVPERLLTNQDLEKLVDTNNEWILQRTGIVERHIVEPGQATSDLATEAVRQLCANTKTALDEIELLIVATVTPDTMFPNTASRTQHKLGIPKTWGVDLNGACCGFVYALVTGWQFVASGVHSKVVVVGADTMSAIVDYKDRATCILFGDGAGAVLLEPATDPANCLIDFHHEIDGSGGEDLKMPAGGSLLPASHETVDQGLHYIKQDGQAVFKFAVRKMEEASRLVLEKNNYTGADVKLLIPHQANARIIRSTAERLGLKSEQVVLNLSKYGNTTAATIPLAISDALADGRLAKGDLVVLASVGAGYTVGAALMRWAI
jgi:3-oxoacyl-[acyl-carrier-protein] synthase-3